MAKRYAFMSLDKKTNTLYYYDRDSDELLFGVLTNETTAESLQENSFTFSEMTFPKESTPIAEFDSFEDFWGHIQEKFVNKS